MPYPIRAYELKHEMLRSYGAFTELATLYGFFCSRQGALDSFLYNDPEDNSVTAQLFGTGDGTTVAFQLGRSLGGFFEPIYNTNATPQIFVNGVLKTVGSDYTINSAGLVTFTVAPSAALPITWTGTYYWRCRFEEDQLSFGEFANLFWKQDGLKFRTLLNG
jgi:uncharacterized protein (TIGR02217 family)